MSNGNSQPVTEALRQEHAEGFRMFTDAVQRISDEEWGRGGIWTEVPARAALHTLLCARYYIAPTGVNFSWEPGGVVFWKSPISELPTRVQMLEQIATVAAETNAYLVQNGDEGLLHQTSATNPARTRVANMIYALRHLQHHVAQISAECKRRGFGAAKWEV